MTAGIAQYTSVEFTRTIADNDVHRRQPHQTPAPAERQVPREGAAQEGDPGDVSNARSPRFLVLSWLHAHDSHAARAAVRSPGTASSSTKIARTPALARRATTVATSSDRVAIVARVGTTSRSMSESCSTFVSTRRSTGRSRLVPRHPRSMYWSTKRTLWVPVRVCRHHSQVAATRRSGSSTPKSRAWSCLVHRSANRARRADGGGADDEAETAASCISVSDEMSESSRGIGSLALVGRSAADQEPQRDSRDDRGQNGDDDPIADGCLVLGKPSRWRMDDQRSNSARLRRLHALNLGRAESVARHCVEVAGDVGGLPGKSTSTRISRVQS